MALITIHRSSLLNFISKISSIPLVSFYLNNRNFNSKKEIKQNSNYNYIHFHNVLGEDEKKEIAENFILKPNFITDEEENNFISELTPHLKRLRYEYDHWDNAIHGFKETEKLHWNETNSPVIDRVRKIAFPSNIQHLPHVHILDLADNGYIKPHIDSVRFCGDIIAGLSLLSDSVMRLINENKKVGFDVLLPRKSLYIMRGCVRYDFTHEILSSEHSLFNDVEVEKKRRISIISRSEPASEEGNV